MRMKNVHLRDGMIPFFDQEIRKIEKEIDKIKVQIRVKHLKQMKLEEIIFERVRRFSYKRMTKKQKMRQGIENLDKQIFYLNGRIVNYMKQIQIYMQLKDTELTQNQF